jgi:hypothetical protein
LLELRKVGAVNSENENVQDVTTEFIDNKARLDNLHKLRNRIQLLLNRADRIEDLLKIERELNRTQSEIDRLEGRMKYLKGQVDYASIEFSAEKQKNVCTRLGTSLWEFGGVLKNCLFGIVKTRTCIRPG